MTNAIVLTELRKNFGEVAAVAGVNLEIADGEFFAMLGPSGSGKTTVLRLIAGFEIPDSGRIEIAGEDVSSTPPFNRDVNTVFQDYALFPHMSVVKNVEYGLRVKGVAKAQRHTRALRALERVKLVGYENRKPSQLSGGQRQRVALARAIVNEPKVLLLDEPLGALDLKLRHEMQKELKELQTQLGITFIFVTHDQEEALTMADRIAVFNQGQIIQIGSPQEIYEKPATEFVAGFVGISNLLHEVASQQILGKSGIFSIRPEKIKFGSQFDRKASGSVAQIQFLGSFTRIDIELPQSDRLTLLQENTGASSDLPTVGSQVQISWDSKYEFQVG
ncbi:MAG: ABC transporter ATP-binding protein [Actinomycetes bacterium]